MSGFARGTSSVDHRDGRVQSVAVRKSVGLLRPPHDGPRGLLRARALCHLFECHLGPLAL
jgi:hypothetical protein